MDTGNDVYCLSYMKLVNKGLILTLHKQSHDKIIVAEASVLRSKIFGQVLTLKPDLPSAGYVYKACQ